MNKKLIKASVAGAAALALAAGGTTFASWSDFGVQQSAAGAGILKLNVSSKIPGQINVKPFSLAPGQNKYQEMFLASADSENVPLGDLTATIKNLVDSEDGAPSCTTNSEAIAEQSTHVDAHGMPTNPLNDCGSQGELSQQLKVQILASDPVADSTDCGSSSAAPGYPYKTTTPSGVANPLASFFVPSKTFNLAEDLKPGEGVCIKIEMSLPEAADNAVQGDEVTFDWRFDLAQAL